MRVLIDTFGTRGDVQPYLALALGLVEAGHSAQLAAPEQFATLARECGVRFSPLPGRLLTLLETPEGKAAVAGSRGFGAGLKLIKHIRPHMRDLLNAEWHAARSFDPDVIVYHPKAIAACHIAEKLKRPAFLASPIPGFTPTSAFPSPMLPFASLGPFNRLSHRLVTLGSRLLFGRLLRDWRVRTLQLPPKQMDFVPAGTIYAFSPHVIPRPADWDQNVLVSGYWFLHREAWKPDDELAAFLRDGPSPIYVGFGSMPALDPERLTEIVLEALAKTERRGVLATGGGAIVSRIGAKHVHFIKSAPHDALFPLMDAVIHHGGAGTTAAAIHAGKPMVVCPFFGDQPFWGRRAAQLGLGPAPIDQRDLTASKLAHAIAAIDLEGARQAAVQLADAVRAETGVATTIRFINESRDIRSVRRSQVNERTAR
jgi:sterol 3beta-glucosyltransferase